MVFIRPDIPPLSLVATVAGKALSSLAEQARKSSADNNLTKLCGAKEHNKLSVCENNRVASILRSVDLFKTSVVNTFDKILKQASIEGVHKKHKYGLLGDIACKLGIDAHEVASALDTLSEGNKREKSKACKCLKKSFAEKIDSIESIKIFAEVLAESNVKSGYKVPGAEKLLKNIIRLEKQIEKVAEDFRLRISSETKQPRFRVLEKQPEPVKAQVVLEEKTEKPQEPRSKDKSLENTGSAAILQSTIESLQKVNELLIEIAEIHQELDFLKSRVKPFEISKDDSSDKMLELEREERQKQKQISYYLAQSSWPSLN